MENHSKNEYKVIRFDLQVLNSVNVPRNCKRDMLVINGDIEKIGVCFYKKFYLLQHTENCKQNFDLSFKKFFLVTTGM